MATLIKNGHELLLDDSELTAISKEAKKQSFPHASLAFIDEAGSPQILPAEISSLLHDVLAIVAETGSISISALPQELTSNTAADLLGVSRPTLLKLARDGKINSFKTGSHTRFSRDTVLEFKKKRELEKQKILTEIIELEDELGS